MQFGNSKFVDKLKARIERKVRQAEVEDRFNMSSGRHSLAYHRQFEGYSEVPVLDQNGKLVKIDRIYTGLLYVQQLSRKQRIALKLGYLALLIGACCLFGWAVVMDVPCNYFWYVSAAEAVVFFGFLWLFLSLVNYFLASGEMKISEYRSGAKHLRYATLLCAAATALAAILALISVLVTRQPFSAESAEYLLKLLFSAALFFAINRLETHIPYEIRDNEVEAPEGAVEIS